jgi:exonuclease III
MTEYGQSGSLRIHTPDNAATDRRANNAREFMVSTYNVRTLRNTANETSANISHKLQQLIVGCNKYQLDIVSIQEHRLHTSNGDNLEYISQGLQDWTLAHTDCTTQSHGVALLYSKRISQVLINIEYKSDRIIAAHLQGNPRVCVVSAYAPTETGCESMKDTF